METKNLSYEDLVKERNSLRKQMGVALENNHDDTFCKLYLLYKNISEQIQEIDDYWNAPD